jgi:hypothetical protein
MSTSGRRRKRRREEALGKVSCGISEEAAATRWVYVPMR